MWGFSRILFGGKIYISIVSCDEKIVNKLVVVVATCSSSSKKRI